MSLSKKASKLNRDITGSGKLTASKDGSIFVQTEQTNELDSVTAYFKNNADVINNSLARIEFSEEITSLDDVIILSKIGENYLFSGEITIVAKDYVDTLTFKYSYNNDNGTIKDGVALNGSALIELVDVVKDDIKYIGIKFTKLGSITLTGFSNTNKFLKKLTLSEYDSIEDNSYLDSEMFTVLPQVPKPGYPMRNTGGVVNSLNNRFYLYPGVQSARGLNSLSSVADEDGFNSEKMSENVFEYNLETNTWKPLRPFPELTYTTAVQELEPGKNIIGGYATSDSLIGNGSFGNGYIHDIVNDTYEKIVFPKAISVSTFILVGDILYFIGGKETTQSAGVYTTTPFYGLFTYNVRTGEYTYDATKFNTILSNNLVTPTLLNNSNLECYNVATYVPSENAIFFSLGCFKSFQKKTIIYKFNVATQTLEEFLKFDEAMSVRRMAFDSKSNSLIFLGGAYSYYGSYPNQTNNVTGLFYTGAVLNIHKVNVTTKEIYLLDPLPSPGFISSGFGQFADGRIIFACGCTSNVQGQYPSYSDPSNKVAAAVPHTNSAMLIDLSKSKTITVANKVNRLIPLLTRNKISTVDKVEWNRSNSFPVNGKSVATIVENSIDKKLAIFSMSSLTWSQSTLPNSVNYRLSILNSALIDYDSLSNTTFVASNPSNYSVLAYSDFSTNTALNKVILFSDTVVPANNDGSSRNISNTTKWYYSSGLSAINWVAGYTNAGKGYFRDTYFEQTNANTFIRDLPVTINYEPNGLIYSFGGKDNQLGYGLAGYGVFVKNSNITFRFTNIVDGVGLTVPPENYSFYGSGFIQLSHTETIVIGGMNYDANGLKSNSTNIFKITIVPKNGITFDSTDSSTFPTLKYTKLADIPYDMVNEGWIRATRADTNNIIFYSGKGKNDDGVNLLNFDVTTNKVTYIGRSACTDLADMVKLDKDFVIPYGLKKDNEGNVEVTPPFVFKYSKYRPSFKFTGFGSVPNSITGVTSTATQIMQGMATVIDSSNKLHYFGGIYGNSASISNMVNLHISCQLTLNADGTITQGAWTQEAIPTSVCTAMGNAQAILLKNGKILIIGGLFNETNYTTIMGNPKIYVTSFYIIYDPSTNTYTKFSPTIVNSPEPTKLFKILVMPYVIQSKVNDNEVFIVGGARTNGANNDYYVDSGNIFSINKVCKLNTATNTMTYLDTFPSNFTAEITPIRNPYSYGDDGLIYFLGQSALTGGDVNNDVFVFDTITEKFDVPDANGNFSITDLTYGELTIPFDLYGDRVSKRMNVFPVNHSNGSTYLIPMTRVNSKLTGYEFNPYSKKYFMEDTWKPIEIDIIYNNQLCPADVSGLSSANDYSFPRLFELSDGRMVAITAFIGQGANTSYWTGGIYPFTLIE